ncbi:hypothetical protein JCM10450v2_005027 [Rhodotorula kratochvilovae]
MPARSIADSSLPAPRTDVETLLADPIAPWALKPALGVRIDDTKEKALGTHLAGISFLLSRSLLVYSDGSLLNGHAGAGIVSRVPTAVLLTIDNQVALLHPTSPAPTSDQQHRLALKHLVQRGRGEWEGRGQGETSTEVAARVPPKSPSRLERRGVLTADGLVEGGEELPEAISARWQQHKSAKRARWENEWAAAKVARGLHHLAPSPSTAHRYHTGLTRRQASLVAQLRLDCHALPALTTLLGDAALKYAVLDFIADTSRFPRYHDAARPEGDGRREKED